MVGTNLIGGHNMPPSCNIGLVYIPKHSRDKSLCPLYAPACLRLMMLVLQNQRLPSSDLLHLKGLYYPTALLCTANQKTKT